MKILAISDKVVEWIYGPNIHALLTGIDLAIGCGDLPHEYLEFIVSALDIPVYFVHGNHSLPEGSPQTGDVHSSGSTNLNGKVLRYQGYTFAGIEGSLDYNHGIFQYSQTEMWLKVMHLVPGLLRNRIRYGSYLNVFVTHAPPWGIHDQPDLPHQGIKAFRWLIARFQPDIHLHGHVHIYRPDAESETQLGRTRVINAYGHKQIDL